MDYTLRDDEMIGPNMQHKKFFDSTADVDSNAIKFMSEDWTLDSIFALNDDFLTEMNELAGMKMDTNLNLSSSMVPETFDRMSPLSSSGTESEIDVDCSIIKPITNLMDEPILSPPHHYISSSSSDSGLSSDNIDFDVSHDYDILGSDLLQQPMSAVQRDSKIQDEENACKIPTPELMESNHPIVAQQEQVVFDEMACFQQNTNKQMEIIQLCNTMTASEAIPKRKIQILKKLSTGPITEQMLTNKATPTEPIGTGTFVINKINGNMSGIRKVIHVKKGPNQKSILLPVSFKNGTDIRSIKIIKPSAIAKSPKILMAASNLLQEYRQNELIKNSKPIQKQPIPERYDDSVSDPSDNESYKFEDMFVEDDDNDDDNIESDQGIDSEKSSEYQKLILSGEERRLLTKEGIALPAHYPLTKHEERELKRIRRKIRNKISAQDSRKRKKEYVDGLEERVKKCTDENQTLLKRIKLLQNQNHNLMSQMKKMQSLLTRGGNKTAQPATCLMVLLLSMALIAAPNLKLGKDNKDVANSDILMEENLLQNRRNLLFDTQEKLSDVLVDEEMANDFVPFYPKSENNDHDYAEAPSFGNKFGCLIDFDVDDTIWTPPNKTKQPENTVNQMKIELNGYETAINEIKTDLKYDSTISRVEASGKNVKNLSETHSKDELDLALDNIPNVIKLTTTNLSPKDV